MRYVVASVDAWGNEVDGWEVNDVHQLGIIDISEEAAEDDQTVVDILNTHEFLDDAELNVDVGIEGEDISHLTIYDFATGEPLLFVILEH